MQPIAIKSSRVVLPNTLRDASIIIANGVITGIEDNLPERDLQVIDLGDAVVMPGVVDPHVHINEPGRTEWEGFDTATKAAIAGGVTSLIEMPLNASPVTTTVKAFEKKLNAAKGKLHANCGFWGGIIPGNFSEIKPLIEKGVFGFKAFLTHSGIDEFPNVTEADLRKSMPLIAESGLPLLVHCELSGPVATKAGSHRSYAHYLASRPKAWEDEAIALMIKLCDEFNCHTHIVHVSSANALQQIADAKHRGLPLTAETCQHYLYFNAEDITDGKTEFKCAPPIREKENNEQLWQALKNGVLDFVATDHSPAPPAMKELQSGDFMKAWGGIASLQYSLSALWTAAKQHSFNIIDIAKWLSENPALLPALQTKGKIEKGYDADFVVWQPEEKFIADAAVCHHRHKVSPYFGETFFGSVMQTWLKGEKVFDAGKFLHLNRGEILLAV
ncbi:MAG: Allantoinase [Bacteroidetes bacterium ADurb.BinA245]|nr:MAG: Allantoinase [Bacteroidetes bacterium ADurb.BinA245]HMW66623.1 allantoinase AllB [Chitinophagaceae bacterium]HNA90875.1 allantoinase AllB [Chitinophagaceae bacterium]HNF38165.1 allantoinase AllB [Chitinophagaceae bacterium]HNO54497.1 allantoinase AllB [Chitinophagaceae bacterium]